MVAAWSSACGVGVPARPMGRRKGLTCSFSSLPLRSTTAPSPHLSLSLPSSTRPRCITMHSTCGFPTGTGRTRPVPERHATTSLSADRPPPRGIRRRYSLCSSVLTEKREAAVGSPPPLRLRTRAIGQAFTGHEFIGQLLRCAELSSRAESGHVFASALFYDPCKWHKHLFYLPFVRLRPISLERFRPCLAKRFRPARAKNTDRDGKTVDSRHRPTCQPKKARRPLSLYEDRFVYPTPHRPPNRFQPFRPLQRAAC
jgi:hypothetical protein